MEPKGRGVLSSVMSWSRTPCSSWAANFTRTPISDRGTTFLSERSKLMSTGTPSSSRPGECIVDACGHGLAGGKNLGARIERESRRHAPALGGFRHERVVLPTGDAEVPAHNWHFGTFESDFNAGTLSFCHVLSQFRLCSSVLVGAPRFRTEVVLRRGSSCRSRKKGRQRAP